MNSVILIRAVTVSKVDIIMFTVLVPCTDERQLDWKQKRMFFKGEKGYLKDRWLVERRKMGARNKSQRC